MIYERCKLTVIGVPLSDQEPLSRAAIEALRDADVIIGESRKRTLTLLKSVGNFKGKIYFLDNIPKATSLEIITHL